MRPFYRGLQIATLLSVAGQSAHAGQAPGGRSAADIPVSSHDRVYLADQFSNTISVFDPSNAKLLGLIKLGDTTPSNLSPLYRGQLLVHGMGFSPDRRVLDVVSIGSNSVTFIDTATNAVKHVEYVGRAPHEAMFTPDGSEVWVTVRGEDYVQVLDGKSYQPKLRIKVPNGPGMTIFSTDGRFGYVCSSFSPETVVVDVKTHAIIARVPQPSSFSPDIAASPDGTQVWQTLKDIGKVQIFSANPPFKVVAVLDTGPITNHVNFADTAKGQFAYVSVGGLNVVKVYSTDASPRLLATIPTGNLPHGLWPSGDGTRIVVGLENGNAVAIIDTATNTVLSTTRSGQAPQGMVYIPKAVPYGDGSANLEALGMIGDAAHLVLSAPGSSGALTSVTINGQGLVDLIQAGVTGLESKHAYVLATSPHADGSAPLTPIAHFMTNPAGAAIVNAIGALRAPLTGSSNAPRQYLVIATATEASPRVLQISH